MPNPDGKNQWGKKDYPTDEELTVALMECSRLSYSVSESMAYLKRVLGLDIKKSTFHVLRKRLEIPTVRDPQLPKEAIDNAASKIISGDTTQGVGPNAVKAMLRTEHMMISRDRIRALFKAIAPEGAEKRYPGKKHHTIHRTPLISLGPFHEISADGHEKLNAQALRMGDISLPIYAYRDKWSGYLLKITVLPDSRTAAAIGHLYLDLVAEYDGIPIQVTTDKGSEIGWQSIIQETFRALCAPNVDPNEFPPSVQLKSVHNTVIESLWRWFETTTGHNLKATILHGMNEHIFYPHRKTHTQLFYWIFVPLIQVQLDKFRDYWNYHKVRFQADKVMPSGHIPAAAFSDPAAQDVNAISCHIAVPKLLQDKVRQELEEEVGPRASHLASWYSEEFGAAAGRAYGNIGSPQLSFDTAWAMFARISSVLADLDDM